MSLAPKKSTPNFRNLQSAFEPPPQDPNNKNLQAIYPPPHRSKAGDLHPSANVPSNNSRITSLTKSIDSVLDTSAAQHRPASPPNRPLAKFRPSWIGPQPSKKTKADVAGHLEPTMKQRVSIDFASPGLQPPVYIFTSLSHPQWEALEMFPVKQMNGEFTFVRNFDVEEGEYQYKFRLGPGDWWVCDERREIVDDGVGNRNNRVVVRAKKAVESGHTSPERDLDAPKNPSDLMSKPAKHAEPTITPPSEVSSIAEIAKTHESFSSPDAGSSNQRTPEAERTDPLEDSNVTKHESVQPERAESPDGEAEPYAAPLLRHESVSPTSHEQDHSPLFRHESIGLGYNHHETAANHPGSNGSPAKPAFRTAMAQRIAPLEADPDDPSLHEFPTDHEGIMNHIQRTHTRLAEDETGEDVTISSPASSSAVSESSSFSAVPSLPSANEENDEQLGKIREAGEQEADAERESGEKLDPLMEGQMPAAEPEDANFKSKIPELKVLVVPKIEKTTEEIFVIDRRPSLTEKVGTRNLMAIAVGLLAFITAVAVVKLFK